jgi:hypothetical protein
VSVSVVTLVFRAYLVDQSMDHLAGTLKRGGIKDLLLFFPPNKRTSKELEDHFKKAGLTPIAEWWAKKQYAVVKEGIVRDLQELCEREEPPEQVRTFLPSAFPVLNFVVARRSSTRSRPAKRSPPYPRLSWFSASGKGSWRPSIGARAQTRSRALPCAKSAYAPFPSYPPSS